MRPAAAADAPLHWGIALVLTLVAYVATGLAAALLAAAPGAASPLYPPAGIALAALLVFGRRVLPAIALGALCVNATLAEARGSVGASAVWLPVWLAMGAVLQAGVGAALVRRTVRQPLTLSEPRDILHFFLFGALAASLVGASAATAGLLLAGGVAREQSLVTWATWWTGDALGTLIVAPIVLTLIGQPRREWAARRLQVGVTLALVALLLSLAIHQVQRWDDERRRSVFEHDAANAAALLGAQLQQPLHALEALRGVFIASTAVDADEMRRASAAWLDGNLQAVGWSVRLRRADVPGLEAQAQAQGLAGYRVFDRADDLGGAAHVPAGDDVVAMRYVEPVEGNAAALGVNAMSLAPARAAVEAAARSDRPAATAGFRLTQQTGNAEATGVVVYRAIYPGGVTPPDEATRRATFTGVVFVTLRMNAVLAQSAARFPAYLQPCLIDAETPARHARLGGAAGCQSASAGLLKEVALPFAGRQWVLRLSARPGDVPDARGQDAWLLALVGLLASSLLGALLLTLTGRTRRIESAVRERTAALEAEVREREEAEAALRESEQRFRNILNNVPIGVIYSDLQGKLIQANPRFCELTGYSDEELLALDAAQYTHPDDVGNDADLAQQLVNGEIATYRRHQRYVSKDGRTIRVQATMSLLRDAQGRPRRIVGVVEDITEHLRLQEAENARERAEASNLAKSEFLSRMSHELRTPLNAMLGFAQLLDLDQRHPLAAAQRPWVSQIQDAGWHLLEMINDVLDLSRIESGNLRLQTEVLDLQILVTATVAMVAGEAQRHRIAITTELAAGAVNVMGDGTRVKQILTNLLTNAVKYNLEGGRVHVSSRLLDGGVTEIAVTDTGLGMSEAQMAELFQPFNRLGRERSQQQGTGIGLVISQRLAELMNGSLRAHSRPGEGSSFVLSLPGVEDPDTIRSDFDDPLVPDPAYHRRIVHYVEDNETNVEVMRGMLAQRPQVRLEVSVNGLDGLLAIRSRRPDLILLDMHLPDISGMELLRHLKADPATAMIPVVVVSADALGAQVEAGMAAGALRYLTKPVAVNTLLEVVDELLEQAQTRFG